MAENALDSPPHFAAFDVVALAASITSLVLLVLFWHLWLVLGIVIFTNRYVHTQAPREASSTIR